MFISQRSGPMLMRYFCLIFFILTFELVDGDESELIIGVVGSV